MEDLGTCDYFDAAQVVAAKVGADEGVRGVLACGTGMGVCIVANKHPKVFAAVAENKVRAHSTMSNVSRMQLSLEKELGFSKNPRPSNRQPPNNDFSSGQLLA